MMVISTTVGITISLSINKNMVPCTESSDSALVWIEITESSD